MTALEIAKEVAKDFGIELSDQEADYVIWEQTGFPEFWNIPKDGNSPEECLRTQLKVYFCNSKPTCDPNPLCERCIIEIMNG